MLAFESFHYMVTSLFFFRTVLFSLTFFNYLNTNTYHVSEQSVHFSPPFLMVMRSTVLRPSISRSRRMVQWSRRSLNGLQRRRNHSFSTHPPPHTRQQP